MDDLPPDASSADLRREVDRAVGGTMREMARVAGLGKQEVRQIAIVGMACRFPGPVDPDEFWSLLQEGLPDQPCPLPTGNDLASRYDPIEPLDPMERLRERALRGASYDLTHLPAPGPGDLTAWRPPVGWHVWGDVDGLRRLTSARELVLDFLLRLITLWRKADPARFARMLALHRQVGRLWVHFRPARAPGRQTVASGHVTRGPDLTRMTVVVRGEPCAVT